MIVSTEAPPISETFFADIMDEEEFVAAIWAEYKYEIGFACLNPQFSKSAMHDAYQCYNIERLDDGMKDSSR